MNTYKVTALVGGTDSAMSGGVVTTFTIKADGCSIWGNNSAVFHTYQETTTKKGWFRKATTSRTLTQVGFVTSVLSVVNQDNL